MRNQKKRSVTYFYGFLVKWDKIAVGVQIAWLFRFLVFSREILFSFFHFTRLACLPRFRRHGRFFSRLGGLQFAAMDFNQAEDVILVIRVH